MIGHPELFYSLNITTTTINSFLMYLFRRIRKFQAENIKYRIVHVASTFYLFELFLNICQESYSIHMMTEVDTFIF